MNAHDRFIAVVITYVAVASSSLAQAQSVPPVTLNQSLAERRAAAEIGKLLASTVTMPPRIISLEELTGILRQHGLPVDLDLAAIEEEGGIDGSTRVEIPGGTLTLESWLDIACRNFKLTWGIRREMIWITTEGMSMEQPEVRMYDVTPIVKVGAHDERARGYLSDYRDYDFDTLIENLLFTIEPESWDAQGGIASMRGIVISGRGYLIVSQSAQVMRTFDRVIATMVALGSGREGEWASKQATHSSLPKTTHESLRRIR